MSFSLAAPFRLVPHGAPAPQPLRRAVLLAFPWITDRDQAPARLTLVSVGFLPVTLIAATAFGVAGLREMAVYALLPSLAVVAAVLVWHPRFASLALGGLAAGLV